MKKPTRADFGWTRQHGWKSVEDIDRWSDALCAWENRPKTPGGRPTTNPIHESWNEISKLFDSSSFYRSRRAFCRWAGINYATFSAKQRKQLGDDMERFILEWDAKGKEDMLDSGGKISLCKWSDDNPNWKTTLQKRPENE